ncbi:protein kinase domain-containing protein [Actinomadura rifamycini]|uniref:protein kinase domain-containing protein n=1 Tax=Actinomadura rifamycini TaxID=31962 RepID=UPI00041B4EA4|nr:protein kinase [Actinomadura rifamycini]
MSTPSAAGRYRIDRLLGTGGFASVWLGHDPDLDAPVAIKILGEHWTLHADVRERFVQEARLLRRADSHRLVQVFDIGELPGGRPYFVMTYADRGTLEERLAADPSGGPSAGPDAGPGALADALALAREIARGAQDLHDLGIVHRDLKPSNVLLRTAPGGGERVMIADLGIARTGDHLSSLTLPAGSPGYMAPEQTQVDGAPDHRADVYGLGALAYHLLTGEPPGAPVRPPGEVRPGIPPEVDAAVLRALEPDRERRWPTAAAFGAALEGLEIPEGGEVSEGAEVPEGAAGPLPAASPASGRDAPRTVPGAGSPRRRRRAVLAAAGALACAVAAGAAFWVVGEAGGGAAATGAAGAAGARWFRPGSDVPEEYRGLIVEAGEWCEMPGLSPALIAAMLKAESGFDPHLADPAKDEYGIARWTPRVLVHWQPGGLDNPEPRPAEITPELSIPAMGRFLCYWGKDLEGVPGDPALNLAATYRTSSETVVKAGGVPEEQRAYAERVRRYLADYRPR